MSYSAVEKISSRTKIEFPKQVKFINAFAHTSEAGKKGGQIIIRKYGKVPGSEKFRKEQWQKWWEKKGKFTTNLPNKARSILKPKESKELAEFIGIMMGDGGMTRYQCKITLNKNDDKEYAHYVKKMIERLFKKVPSMHERESVLLLEISSTELVAYMQSLGLHIGNKLKQGLDIPEWVKNNEVFSRACIRGIFDTDGCVVTHTYMSKGHMYSYKKLTFTSASPKLLTSIAHVLSESGFTPRVRPRDVWLDSKKDVSRYFKIVDSSNPKHLNRLHS